MYCTVLYVLEGIKRNPHTLVMDEIFCNCKAPIKAPETKRKKGDREERIMDEKDIEETKIRL